MKTSNIITHMGKKGALNIMLIIFTCFILFGNYGFVSEPAIPKGAKWVKYSTDEGKAKLKFPYQFEVTEEEKENGKTVKVQAKNGNNMFYFAYTLHNSELIDAEHLAEISLESFAETLKGKINSQEEFIVNDHKGLKAKIVMEESDADVYYRAIIIGQIQYQLIVLDVSKTINEERDKFFESFQIFK